MESQATIRFTHRQTKIGLDLLVRIFATLAVIATALVLVNFCLGLNIGDLNEARFELRPLYAKMRDLESQSPQSRAELKQAREEFAQAKATNLRPVEDRATWHVNVGVIVTLGAVLVSCIAVTYFVGTGKWVYEVVGAYQLPDELIARSRRIKRQAFPWAVISFFVLLANACLGMLSYVDAGQQEHSQWATLHLATACTSLFLIAGAFYLQWLKIVEHFALIQEVLSRVTAIRKEKGLPVEA